MKKKVNERRRMMVETFLRTWSLKLTIKAVSKRFVVSETSLRVDWQRRHMWPKEVFERLGEPLITELYLMAIHKTLAQIEGELTENMNPSCRVGLLKAKAEILFRLIEVQKSFAYEVLVKKVEKLENKLESLQSRSQEDEVKLR